MPSSAAMNTINARRIYKRVPYVLISQVYQMDETNLPSAGTSPQLSSHLCNSRSPTTICHTCSSQGLNQSSLTTFQQLQNVAQMTNTLDVEEWACKYCTLPNSSQTSVCKKCFNEFGLPRVRVKLKNATGRKVEQDGNTCDNEGKLAGLTGQSSLTQRSSPKSNTEFGPKDGAEIKTKGAEDAEEELNGAQNIECKKIRLEEPTNHKGAQMDKWIKEARELGFSVDDLKVAINKGGSQNPVQWLCDCWPEMVNEVIQLANSYGYDKNKNSGILSEAEVKRMLHKYCGDLNVAAIKCVRHRRKGFLELQKRGTFLPDNILDALFVSEGNVEVAYQHLLKT